MFLYKYFYVYVFEPLQPLIRLAPAGKYNSAQCGWICGAIEEASNIYKFSRQKCCMQKIEEKNAVFKISRHFFSLQFRDIFFLNTWQTSQEFWMLSLYGKWSTSSHSSSSLNDGMVSEWQKWAIPGSFPKEWCRNEVFSSLPFQHHFIIQGSFQCRMTIEWQKSQSTVIPVT